MLAIITWLNGTARKHQNLLAAHKTFSTPEKPTAKFFLRFLFDSDYGVEHIGLTQTYC